MSGREFRRRLAAGARLARRAGHRDFRQRGCRAARGFRRLRAAGPAAQRAWPGYSRFCSGLAPAVVSARHRPAAVLGHGQLVASDRILRAAHGRAALACRSRFRANRHSLLGLSGKRAQLAARPVRARKIRCGGGQALLPAPVRRPCADGVLDGGGCPDPERNSPEDPGITLRSIVPSLDDLDLRGASAASDAPGISGFQVAGKGMRAAAGVIPLPGRSSSRRAIHW